MELYIGIIIGWISLYVFGIIKKVLNEKKGSKSKELNNIPLTVKLRDTIRHIIFEYNIKRKNNDFLLNIDLDSNHVMQIMHRAHFPELCESESDIKFGLALYIPMSNLSLNKIEKIKTIIAEESEPLKENNDVGNLSYYVIDIGTRIRFGGYLLSRIIKEVFNREEKNMKLELFSEGDLPYYLNIN